MTTSKIEGSGEVTITIEDLLAFDFEPILAMKCSESVQHTARTCQQYSLNFNEEEKLATDHGNRKRALICAMFGGLTSLLYMFDDSRDYLPRFERWLKDEYTKLLGQFVRDIQDAELKARIADVLWHYRINEYYKFAELAVDSYLESADALDTDKARRECAERLDRALQIAASLGKSGNCYSSVIDAIEERLLVWRNDKIRVWPPYLLRLLEEQRRGEPGTYAQYATELADAYEDNDDWEGARTVWRIAERWHKLAGDESAAKVAQLRAAQTYEAEAKMLLQLKSNNNLELKVIHTLKCGIEALRRAHAEPSEVDRVHTFLLDRQASPRDFSTYENSIDFTDVVV